MRGRVYLYRIRSQLDPDPAGPRRGEWTEGLGCGADQGLHAQTREESAPVRRSRGPGPGTALGEGIARGAAVVAGLTILSRVLGLVRTLVFSQTVGASCLGTAYVTANQVPDLLYQLILGGALTSAMVPVLARSAERAPVPSGEGAGQPDHLGAADLDRCHRGAAGDVIVVVAGPWPPC